MKEALFLQISLCLCVFIFMYIGMAVAGGENRAFPEETSCRPHPLGDRDSWARHGP